MDEKDLDYLGKIILLGSAAVGKSNMMNRFLKGIFEETYLSTIGINCLDKKFNFDGKKVKIKYFDTAGQERYDSLSSTVLRKADGAIFVYSITSRESFNKINFWITELTNKGNNSKVLMLIGNKSDLEEEREVSFQEGETKANEIGCPFMETSAKTGENIAICFEKASRILFLKTSEDDNNSSIIPGSFDLNNKNKKGKKGCCGDNKK